MQVEVIPETKSFKSETFTYAVPKDLQKDIGVGHLVIVPFGKQKIRAVVKEIISPEYTNQPEYPIKEILSDLGFFLPKQYFRVIDWLQDSYFCTAGEALSLFLPPEMKRPPKAKLMNSNHPSKIKELSQAQSEILTEILKSNSRQPHLIYGVTGSGKTEIYIHLCQHYLNLGKSVVVLVPEIILTPQTVERFTQAFGDNIALLHSRLSQGERFRAYEDFRSGQKQVIIGPRSALLVPNNNIGLIIIDEEHEDAYKQDQSPRYHAVDLAEKIAEALSACLVLGSATPRVESYYKASSGKYLLHQLKSRYNKLMLPPAEIIDLRNELRSQNSSVISERLHKAIDNILKKQKQAILFLNRRGASTFVSCRECGEVIKCKNCDIPLVHHSSNGSYLYCHHCDLKAPIPTECPNCHGVKIKFFGTGVEKVESEVKKIFPQAKVRRIDAETIKSRSDYNSFYTDFKNRKFDIAIGTQMITKGLDLPHVDLVGIISADTGLHLPYFRASEKIFRLVTQVSGRSGRAANSGQTIIQTYWPGSSAIKFAANHDFEGFYNHEVANRQKHGYPPFARLIRIVSENEDSEKAKHNLETLATQLDSFTQKYPEGFDYIGPGLCFFQRMRGKWRYHLIIKLLGEDEEQLSKIMSELRELWKNHLKFVWDYDPSDLL